MASEAIADEDAMRIALGQARYAAAAGDVPIGAVVIHDGSVIAKAHNERERAQDPTAHAEIIALRAAARELSSWRLGECTVVVTLEPCAMCAGALVLARVARLVFGATDPKAGACGSLYNLLADPRLNHEVPISRGVLEADCAQMLTDFFGRGRAGSMPGPI
ncbi:MAG: tRNA adenosine(34) deaminase TadA [Acidimicrobiales bacterium]